MSRIAQNPADHEPGWYYMDDGDVLCGPYETETDAQIKLDEYWDHRDMMDFGWSENTVAAMRRQDR